MFNLHELIQAVGYLGIFGIIFAETGLLIGFFLPGDSLLFTAGILAAEGYFNIYLLLIIMLGAAIIGNSLGYSIGKRFGPKIFTKDESLLFNKKHVRSAEEFFKKYGVLTLILARFVPVIRTFVPVLAGVGRMNYARFMLNNILGAILWIVALTLLGYYLGLKVENIEKYILPIAALIIFISIAPYLKRIITDPSARETIIKFWNRAFKKN